MIAFTVDGLKILLAVPHWTIVEFSGVLDHWTGLVDFEDTFFFDDYEDDAERLQVQVKVNVLIHQITDRFLSACRFANNHSELRHPGAFVILPAPGAGTTMIAGMVFKLDNGGMTYICFPQEYQQLWEVWFGLCSEKIDWFVVD